MDLLAVFLLLPRVMQLVACTVDIDSFACLLRPATQVILLLVMSVFCPKGQWSALLGKTIHEHT